MPPITISVVGDAADSNFRFAPGSQWTNEPAGTRDLLAVQRRLHLAGVDEVELLLARLGLVVLGDEDVAGVLRDGVDAEAGDAEVVADRLPGRRPVVLDGRDLVDVGDLPASLIEAPLLSGRCEARIVRAPSLRLSMPEEHRRRQRLTLAATVLGSSLAFVDATVVVVALPTIQDDLHFSLAGEQWVFLAYSLALAALYLPAGAIGDRKRSARDVHGGHRRLRARVGARRCRARPAAC